jgi:hypothetical protein
MGEVVSFVARNELKDWLKSRADEEMKSISALCRDIVAEEYRRQNQPEPDKGGETQVDKGGSTPDPLESETVFRFATKREADAVRTQFEDAVSENDDARLKEVTISEGAEGEVVKELERRSEG